VVPNGTASDSIVSRVGTTRFSKKYPTVMQTFVVIGVSQELISVYEFDGV
jgi:hypothetical protein